MTIDRTTLDQILFVRWPQDIESVDVSAYDEAMAEARRTLGKPLFLVAVIPEGIKLPAWNVQQALIRRVMKMRAVCTTMHAVMLGRGLTARIGRKFLSGMAITTGVAGQGFVHATVDDAIKELAKHGELDVAAMMARVKAVEWLA